MSDLTGVDSSHELVLTHALEKLRARDGLTLARLEAGRHELTAPLLALPAVRRHAAIHGTDPARAALEVVLECVRGGLLGTAGIVADAVLALGAFAEAHGRGGVDPSVVAALRSDLLRRRRSALLANWRRLHEALGLPIVDAPSDRVLRGTMEGAVLRELARQLIRLDEYRALAEGFAGPGPVVATSNGAGRRPRGRVVVVGGAVMDATFHTKVLPQRETSSEAHAFNLSPGGKGLTQAVAAARLGLQVSLVAAVADDRFGREIVEYLNTEGVDTSLLKFVSDARTPFTGVIEFELGDSIAVNWRNEREVRLDVRDIDRLAPRLEACDAVLVTFEIPRDSMQRALAVAHRTPRRPVVVVTPGQPYPDGGISGQALAQIDYLVAHPWELGRYAPPDGTFDIDAVARRVLAYGVETLCVPVGGGCTIYSETPLGSFTVPTFPSTYKESSAARDAFCAALAAKLIECDGEFSEDVAFWATAAMAVATADYPLPNSMPDRPRVEQFLSRSRFTVTPRPSVSAAVEIALAAARPPSLP